MSSFLNNLINRFRPAPAVGAPQINLAAFGKHPGWNDHMDDLGLETQRLVDVKRILYVDGIGGNIDRGAWDKLSDAQRTPAFDHLFLCHTAGDVVLGRFWSSTDGKGRARYPMVLCAQCVGLPLGWCLEQVLPRIERIAAACRAATGRTAVLAAVDAGRAELRQLLTNLPDPPVEQPVSPDPLVALAARPELGADHRGLWSILYQMERDLGAFRSARPPRRPHLGMDARHLRLPRCADSPGDAMLLWMRFLLTQIEPTSPVFLLLPVDAQWIDLLVGDPAVEHFVCICARPNVFPLVSDIPYNFDAEFMDRCHRLIPPPPNTQPPSV